MFSLWRICDHWVSSGSSWIHVFLMASFLILRVFFLSWHLLQVAGTPQQQQQWWPPHNRSESSHHKTHTQQEQQRSHHRLEEGELEQRTLTGKHHTQPDQRHQQEHLSQQQSHHWDCRGPQQWRSQSWTTSHRWSSSGWREFHWDRGSCTWQDLQHHQQCRCGMLDTQLLDQHSNLMMIDRIRMDYSRQKPNDPKLWWCEKKNCRPECFP